MNLDSCKFWQINEIHIDGEIKYGEGDYSKDDFLSPVSEVEMKKGNLYLMGFERNLICEVVDITSEYCKRSQGYENTRVILHLKKVFDLEEQTVEIKRAGENTFTIEVTNG